MRKVLQCLLVCSLTWFGISCDSDENEVIKQPQYITFSFSKQDIPGGRTQVIGTPTSIVISVENAAGQLVIDSRKLQLLGFGDNYVTENVLLEVGNYKLSSFLVLDQNNKTLYATPRSGSPKAEFVERPLPILFNVAQGNSSTVRAEVLEVENTDTPEQFGYTSFGFDVVPGDKLNIRVRVEMTVGQIHYQDLDAKVKITGFNANNEAQWMQEFSYTGPVTNMFAVKKGFHHYELSTTNWGVTDRQIVSAEQLQQSAEQPLPMTFVLGGAKAAKKLAYYVTSIERPDPAQLGKTYLEPQAIVNYEYNANGKLEKMKVSEYVDSLEAFKEQRYFLFSYENGSVSKLTGYHTNAHVPYLEDIYTYQDGRVINIQEINYGTGVTTDVAITYSDLQQLVSAAYTNSNGTTFIYQFNYVNKNITSDKTSRFGILCSTGAYVNDKKINPFAHLGYLDIFFKNFSISNRISESVNYTGCAFPTLIPESYVHTYDNDGYPIEEKTVYKGSDLIMKTQFIYQ